MVRLFRGVVVAPFQKGWPTGLTAGNDVNSGTVKFVIGIMMICSPYLLDAIQKTLGLH